MPPEPRDDRVYLWDMLQYLKELEEITRDKSIEDLRQERVLYLAVERVIEVVGEAARKVSEEFEKDHPEINWAGIRGQRHVIAHEYGQVDIEKIWLIISEHGPALRRRLEQLVEDRPAVTDDPDAASENTP